MIDFCIVLPIYEEHIDECSRISIMSLLDNVAGKGYDIYILTYRELCLDEYMRLYSFKTIFYPKEMFESNATYSTICLDYNFYKYFENYKYIFIFQTDCFMFKDEISKWCGMNYEYVGAPIMSKSSTWKLDEINNIPEPCVGNGGLSLRKTSAFIKLLDRDGDFMKSYNISDDYMKSIKVEDKWICNTISKLYYIDKPKWQLATEFSWDMNPDILELYGFNRPMGIHAIWKNIRYWKNKIKEITPESIDISEKKYKNFFKYYYKGENKDKTYIYK